MVAIETSKRRIAQEFGVTEWALYRHMRHLEETLSESARAAEIARADDLVPRLEKAVNVAEEVMGEARAMKFDRIKAGHLTLHATRRIQSGLGTLTAAVDRRKVREDEANRQDLEGIRVSVREKLGVLRDRMIEELARRNRPNTPVSEGSIMPPVPKAGVH